MAGPFLYLGERPPWEQFVGEVSGLLRLLGCRRGVRPAELLGDACGSMKQKCLDLM